MYTLRQFMRMNGVKADQIEQFVAAVSGKKLSVREIEQLAHGYFLGPESFRQEIRKGNLALPLERLRQAPQSPDGCSEFERVLLKDLEILDQQALEWSTVRLEHRPQGKGRLIPAKAFEHEQAYLIELPPYLPAPYRTHTRGIDEYGYAAFDGNFYWVPGTGRGSVTVIEYAQAIKICRQRQCLAQYPLPADGVRNQFFSPEGFPAPRHSPRNRKQPAQEEEKRLRCA